MKMKISSTRNFILVLFSLICAKSYAQVQLTFAAAHGPTSMYCSEDNRNNAAFNTRLLTTASSYQLGFTKPAKSKKAIRSIGLGLGYSSIRQLLTGVSPASLNAFAENHNKINANTRYASLGLNATIQFAQGKKATFNVVAGLDLNYLIDYYVINKYTTRIRLNQQFLQNGSMIIRNDTFYDDISDKSKEYAFNKLENAPFKSIVPLVTLQPQVKWHLSDGSAFSVGIAFQSSLLSIDRHAPTKLSPYYVHNSGEITMNNEYDVPPTWLHYNYVPFRIYYAGNPVPRKPINLALAARLVIRYHLAL
jgi:hypothetical protein